MGLGEGLRRKKEKGKKKKFKHIFLFVLESPFKFVNNTIY